MAFQSLTISGYRTGLAKLVEFATSQHISAIVINNAGTGYTAGDTLAITHAGASLDAAIEVLTVGGGGDITSAIIRSAGAFSNRLASAVVNAGGSGYVVNDVLRVTGGTYTQRAKVRVATLSGSAVATVTVEEAGGAYTVAPGLTGAATVGVGPAAFAGNDACTLDLTMTGMIGTTGIAATGGTGASATFDLTLTATGWTEQRDWHDYSFNSLTDQKEVILLGTVAGGDAPYIGLRSYTATVGPDTLYGWLVGGMDNYNDGLAFNAQPNIGPVANSEPDDNTGCNILLFNNSQDAWFSVDGRCIIAVIKTVGASTTAYQTLIAGLLEPYGTATEAPYPLYLSGSSSIYNRIPDAGGFQVTGPTELFAETATACPAFFRRASDGSWLRAQNSNNGSPTRDHVIFPIGEIRTPTTAVSDRIVLEAVDFRDGFTLTSGSAATALIMPTVSDDELLLIPCTLMSTPTTAENTTETIIRGQLPRIFWIPGTKADASIVAAEDTIVKDGIRYRIFQNAYRTTRYSYFALQES